MRNRTPRVSGSWPQTRGAVAGARRSSPAGLPRHSDARLVAKVALPAQALSAHVDIGVCGASRPGQWQIGGEYGANAFDLEPIIRHGTLGAADTPAATSAARSASSNRSASASARTVCGYGHRRSRSRTLTALTGSPARSANLPGASTATSARRLQAYRGRVIAVSGSEREDNWQKAMFGFSAWIRRRLPETWRAAVRP